MDEHYLEPQDLASFMAACRERGLSKTILAWQDEWAQAPRPDQVDYARVIATTLLAYHQGLIIRTTTTIPRHEAQAALTAAGFTVELRDRNLTR